ncbi:MAG: hypothetical protein EPO28_18035 [Saprospiraceae bacterium]|nr:MAG: hypothetical protein EPO28_18035 [Saprospiraceae bacterium]
MKHVSYFRKILLRRLLIPAVFLAAAYLPCLSQIQIYVSGHWTYSVPASNITEAGLDFTGTYTSSSKQVLISIDNDVNRFNYRVDVRRSDISWNSSIEVWARRTGNGKPKNSYCWVSGGTSYQQITTSNQLFFTGYGRTDDIPIRYQLRKISVLIPATNYSTTIIYTVTEL